jgi:hypothetical protein
VYGRKERIDGKGRGKEAGRELEKGRWNDKKEEEGVRWKESDEEM